MLIALIARDKAGHIELRKANRAEHIEYLKSGTVVSQAGPLLSDEGDMIGSLIILDVVTLEDAHTWSSYDPYVKAGLFESVEFIHWNKVI